LNNYFTLSLIINIYVNNLWFTMKRLAFIFTVSVNLPHSLLDLFQALKLERGDYSLSPFTAKFDKWCHTWQAKAQNHALPLRKQLRVTAEANFHKTLTMYASRNGFSFSLSTALNLLSYNSLGILKYTSFYSGIPSTYSKCLQILYCLFIKKFS